MFLVTSLVIRKERKSISEWAQRGRLRERQVEYTYGLGKCSHVVVERLGRANVAAGGAWFTWSAGG